MNGLSESRLLQVSEHHQGLASHCSRRHRGASASHRRTATTAAAQTVGKRLATLHVADERIEVATALLVGLGLGSSRSRSLCLLRSRSGARKILVSWMFSVVRIEWVGE